MSEGIDFFLCLVMVSMMFWVMFVVVEFFWILLLGWKVSFGVNLVGMLIVCILKVGCNPSVVFLRMFNLMQCSTKSFASVLVNHFSSMAKGRWISAAVSRSFPLRL